MTLKPRILRSLTRLFIILVSLMRSLFTEKMLISNKCISDLMANLIKKSWTVSNVYLTRLWLRTWLFYFLGDSFVAFTNEKLILLKTLDRENLSNGHSIRVVLQCSLWESAHRRILKRFTQKVFVIVEDIDDHELFPSTKTLLIVNADSKAMKEVLVI